MSCTMKQQLSDGEAAAIGWQSRRVMWTRRVASVTSRISVQVTVLYFVKAFVLTTFSTVCQIASADHYSA